MPEPLRARFDLLEEPWIPCETPAGGRIELGIRAVLHRAHELTALHDESPLVTAVLHRLLLAIVDRALQPKTRDDWLALWRAERLPATEIDAYLEKWKARFDLFDSERPFMQVAGLEEKLLQDRLGRDKDKAKPAERTPMWRMVMERSACGGHIHVFERRPPETELTAAAAARALLAFLAFTSGGRLQNESESWTGGVLRGGATILLRGATLRETLILNVVARASRAAADVPPWERDRDIARTRRALAGPTDLMVWPSRRVLLFPIVDGSGVLRVDEVVTAAGERLDDDAPDQHMAYYIRNPKEPPYALRFDPNRSVWRDCTALFDAATGHGRFRQPEPINQLADLIRSRLVPRALRLSAEFLGMANDKKIVAVILISRAERMPLPPSLLADPNRVEALKRALQLAEGVGLGLDRQVLFVLCERALAPSDRQAHKDDIQKLKDSLAAMPAYWSALGQAFERWLVELGDADDPDEAVPTWKSAVRRAAQEAFDDACRRLGTNARGLQAAAQAEGTLSKILAEHLGDRSKPVNEIAPNAPQEGATS